MQKIDLRQLPKLCDIFLHEGGGISSGMTVSAAAAWNGPAQQVFGIGRNWHGQLELGAAALLKAVWWGIRLKPADALVSSFLILHDHVKTYT